MSNFRILPSVYIPDGASVANVSVWSELTFADPRFCGVAIGAELNAVSEKTLQTLARVSKT